MWIFVDCGLLWNVVYLWSVGYCGLVSFIFEIMFRHSQAKKNNDVERECEGKVEVQDKTKI